MHRKSRNKSCGPKCIELPSYDEIGLVLQGGGALGSYQAGVYEGLAEAGIEPGWVLGISIGALNTAIIAGNAPKDRAEALRIACDILRTDSTATGVTLITPDGEVSYVDGELFRRGGGRA